MSKYVVVCGNNFNIFGPFESYAEANDWLRKLHEVSGHQGWTHDVVRLSAPARNWREQMRKLA